MKADIAGSIILVILNYKKWRKYNAEKQKIIKEKIEIKKGKERKKKRALWKKKGVPKKGC